MLIASAGFDSDKQRVRQAFGNASAGYDDFAHLQRIVADVLVQKSALTKLQGRVLDIGCGTGYLTKIFQVLEGNARFVGLDIAQPMLQAARRNLTGDISYVCADAERLPLQTASIDYVVSNLALQWCRNLLRVFTEFRRILNANGCLAFSTFGPQTLIELKQAWAVVDQYKHVNDFYSSTELRAFLGRSGWRNCRIEQQLYQIEYSSVGALMRELKGLGAHHVRRGRNAQLTGKLRMQRMFDAYPKLAHSDRILASFEVIWVMAEAGRS